MSSPKVNDGIHGALNFNPALIKALKEDIANLRGKYPIADVDVHLSSTSDLRWNGKKESEKCNSCYVSEAGYKTETMCKGCSELE